MHVPSVAKERATDVERRAGLPAQRGEDAAADGEVSAPRVPAQGGSPESGAGAPEAAALSERDLAVLAFERHWWRHAGAKEQAIREQFAMSATRYYQVLNAVIDCPEAMEQEPAVVKRLRRLRAARQRARSPRRPAEESE